MTQKARNHRIAQKWELAIAGMEATIDSYLAGQLTFQTRRAYKNDIIKFFGGTPTIDQVRKLTTDEVIAWRNDLINGGDFRAAPNSINRRMAVLSTFYEYLARRGMVTVNPFDPAEVKRIKVSTWTPSLGLDEVEFVKLLEACNEGPVETSRRDWTLIKLGYETMMRRSEIANMRWEDIYRDGGKYFIRIPTAKGGTDQRVPLNDSMLEPFSAYYKSLGPRAWTEGQKRPIEECRIFLAHDRAHFGKPLSPEGINLAIKKRAAMAGLSEDVTAHTLRHTGVTHLLAKDVPLHRVQQIARHKDPATTMIYNSLRDRYTGNPTGVLSEVSQRARQDQRHP